MFFLNESTLAEMTFTRSLERIKGDRIDARPHLPLYRFGFSRACACQLQLKLYIITTGHHPLKLKQMSTPGPPLASQEHVFVLPNVSHRL